MVGECKCDDSARRGVAEDVVGQEQGCARVLVISRTLIGPHLRVMDAIDIHFTFCI